MTTESVKVTVVIPVKNEEKNLPECLGHLGRFSEVLVVDSGSTDRTLEICEAHGVKVLQFCWNGEFPKKRNWTLRNHKFQNEWVLFLDADEFVSPEFVSEVERAVSDPSKVGYWLNYKNFFLSGKLRFGESMRKLALFRIGSGEYERIDECSWSHLDMEVHEHPVLDGAVGHITTPIFHKDYKGIGSYLAKHDAYAEWEANRYVALSAPESKAQQWHTGRQKMKYRHLTKWWLAPAYFAYSYIYKLGFLDGRRGLVFCLLKFHYFFQIRLRILEKLAAQNSDGS